MRYYIFAGILMSTLLISLSFGGGFARLKNVTYDDASALRYAKNEQAQSNNVLGVNSDNPDFLCPQNKPIIGWIDYFGNKLIVDSLSGSEEPSSCFENIEEANQNGYFRNND